MDNKNNEIIKTALTVYKRRYLFISLFILITTVGIIGAHFVPKKYEANSTVFIQESLIKNLVQGIAVTPDMKGRVKVLKYALLSRDLISKVLGEMGINYKSKGPAALDSLVTSIQKRTKIILKGRDGLFTVSFVDKDPAFAQDFTNRLIQTYLEDNLSSKRKETYGANRFLDEQISLFRNKLNKAQDAIIDFRKKHDIYVTDDEKTVLDDIKQYNDSINTIDLNLLTSIAQESELKRQLKRISPTVSIFSEQQKHNQIQTLQKKIKQLLVTYTDKYPEVVQLEAQVQALKAQKANGNSSDVTQNRMTSVNPVFQEVQQKLFDLETQISAQKAKRKRLKELLDQRIREVRNVPENRKKIELLMQERDSLKRIYDQLLTRMGQSEVSKQMEIGAKTTNFRVVDPALYPVEPVSPNMVKMILAALMLGIGGGLGGVFLAENIAGTVTETKQLQDLGLDVLAIIPKIRDHAAEAQRRRKDLLVYGFTAVYFSGVICLLAYETLKRLI